MPPTPPAPKAKGKKYEAYPIQGKDHAMMLIMKEEKKVKHLRIASLSLSLS
jgi:hypothetical protein